jgi:acid phosphatase family membrane protein YuiD
MSFWNSRPTNLRGALTRAGILYALVTCLAVALAIKEGSSTDLFSGAFIFVLGGVVFGLAAWVGFVARRR